MATESVNRSLLQNWNLYKKISTGEYVYATMIRCQDDKKDVAEYLFDEEDKPKYMLSGDMVILAPNGFITLPYVPFCTRYRRVQPPKQKEM